MHKTRVSLGPVWYVDPDNQVCIGCAMRCYFRIHAVVVVACERLQGALDGDFAIPSAVGVKYHVLLQRVHGRYVLEDNKVVLCFQPPRLYAEAFADVFELVLFAVVRALSCKLFRGASIDPCGDSVAS
jgi:hypothetical protein